MKKEKEERKGFNENTESGKKNLLLYFLALNLYFLNFGAKFEFRESARSLKKFINPMVKFSF